MAIRTEGTPRKRRGYTNAETARKVLQDAGRSAFEEGEGDYDGLTCRLPQDEKPGWKFIPAGLFPSVWPANPAHTGAATPHRPGKTASPRQNRQRPTKPTATDKTDSDRQNRQRPVQTDRLRSQTRPHTSAAHPPPIHRPFTVIHRHPPSSTVIRRPSAAPSQFHNIKIPVSNCGNRDSSICSGSCRRELLYLRACGYKLLALLVARELHEVLRSGWPDPLP